MEIEAGEERSAPPVHAGEPPRSRARRPTGLTSDDARRRLSEAGTNEITRQTRPRAWRLFIAQLRGPMMLVLLAAGAGAAIAGDSIDAIAIAAIVLLNAIVGFVQEFRAERAVLALRDMTAPRARVLRDGHPVTLAARDVVPGDVLLLDAGDLVAADARLFEANVLRTNEAPLTGESAPVEKSVTPTPADAPLAERSDRVFQGTAVVTGTGVAEVTATGMGTELGRIAGMLADAGETETPLEKRLERVGSRLLRLSLFVVVVISVLGWLRGRPIGEVLLSTVSLAVAAVPEGLAAVVTIALAVGVQRMARRHVLIRRLASVETLGCATVICTDKTGTLTTGVMVMRDLWGPDRERLLRAAASCCDATLGTGGKADSGDPTEIAILRAAAGHGISRERIDRVNERVAVLPFDPERKRMSILRADGVLYVKGAFEVVSARCRSIPDGATEANVALAGRGLRVLAIATGAGPREEALELLGLVGIADPPRAEAVTAIAKARAAGIRTVMITGDHPATAQAVARELGLVRPGEDPSDVVHARATAAEKLEIVRAWKSRGEIVAMTGDGVNDAPAIREAHIGIAMGKSGTEVTREASDMVLADDDYTSIIAAVQEGRGVYENIQKTLVYLLSGNAGELALMLAATLAGFPTPLLPLHLLWINLVTDGLPALTLVMDPADERALSHPPRKPDSEMLGRREWRAIAFTGLLEATLVLGVFLWVLGEGDLARARDVAFTTLVFAEVFRSFSARSRERVFWEVGAFTNLRLLAVVVLTVLLQIAIHEVSFAREALGLVSLSAFDTARALAIGLVPVTVLEVAKLVNRGWRRTWRGSRNRTEAR